MKGGGGHRAGAREGMGRGRAREGGGGGKGMGKNKGWEKGAQPNGALAPLTPCFLV